MSFDEDFLALVAASLNKSQIDAVVIGNAGSILHGAPVLTEDVDLFLLDTPSNRRKLKDFARRVGGSAPAPIDDTYKALRIYAAAPIDLLFWIGENLRFGTVRSRSRKVAVGKRRTLQVASLRDIINSKEQAARPKDIASLPILRDTLSVEEAAKKVHGNDE